jgi:Ca-activated chloride channel family protein
VVGQSTKQRKSAPHRKIVDTVVVHVVDSTTNEPIPFAGVAVYRNKTAIVGSQTNIEGKAMIYHLIRAKDYVTVRTIGYIPKSVTIPKRVSKKTLELKVKLVEDKSDKEYVVGMYKKPLELERKASRSISAIVAHDANLSIRGARSSSGVSYGKVKASPHYNIRRIRPRYHTPKMTKEEAETRDEFKNRIPNKWIETKEENTSTFSSDVDVASYGFCRRMLDAGKLPDGDAVRAEEFINAMHYDYPLPESPEIIALNTSFYKSPWSREGILPWSRERKLLRVGLKTREVTFDKVPACNLVFLLDVSGSMGVEGKLGYVKQSMAMLTERLRAKDLVSIVVYAGAAGIVLDGVEGIDKTTILAALEKLESGGSTAGGEGIELAYKTAESHFIKEGVNRVILCTDGDFNVGVSSEKGLEELIEAKRQSNIFLSVLGYGMGNYKDNRLETLADKGNGNYAYINTLADARKVLVENLTGTIMTLAKDCKFQIAFNNQVVSKYRLVGYEDRLLENEDFANDQKDAGEIGAGQTVTLFYELEMAPGYMEKNENLAELSVRYKLPDGDTSTLRTHQITTVSQDLKDVSPSTVLATCAAAFALQLQGELSTKDFSLAANAKLLKDHDLQNTKDGAQLLSYINLADKLKDQQAKAPKRLLDE